MFGRDGVQIFEIKGDTLRKIFEDERRSGWVPQQLAWKSDELIRLTVRLLSNGRYTSVDKDLSILAKGGAWQIRE